MSIKEIPHKFRRSGVKVKCLKCKRNISPSTKCFEDGKSIPLNQCGHLDKHKFNLIVCVPGTTNTRRTKISHSDRFEAALSEWFQFKDELQKNGYQSFNGYKPEKKNTPSDLLVDLIVELIDFQSGENTPEHLIRLRSSDHISDCRRSLERFCKSLIRKKVNLDFLKVSDVTDDHVGIFHSYLMEHHSPSKSTYNRQFRILKAFFSWIRKHRSLDVGNPFDKVELSSDHKENKVISQLEFKNLLKAITRENGKLESRKGDRSNLYFPWLKDVFILALETGLRREELINLKFDDIETIGGIEMFKIPNLKVNRIQFGNPMTGRMKYIPITKGVRLALKNLGYENKKATNQFVIERPEGISGNQLMRLVSRAFGHFFSLISERNLQFKCLRKTYITSLIMKVGENAKLYTGHSNSEVLKQHYLSQGYAAANLSEFCVFTSHQ